MEIDPYESREAKTPLKVRAIRVQFSEPFGGKASKEETEGSLAL